MEKNAVVYEEKEENEHNVQLSEYIEQVMCYVGLCVCASPPLSEASLSACSHHHNAIPI